MEIARRGDEGCSGLWGAGWVGVELQKINNKYFKKGLRYSVNHAIIEPTKSIAVSTSTPGSAISRERVIPTHAGSVKHGLAGYAGTTTKGGRRMQRIERELTKAGIPYASEYLGGNILGLRIGNIYIVEHGSGTGYYFGDLEDAGEACYTLEEVLELAKKYWGETEIEGIGVVVIAIVEVGEDYIDQLITIKTNRCSLEEAKKEARDAGYRVIDECCHVVPTTHEVQIIVAVEPE